MINKKIFLQALDSRSLKAKVFWFVGLFLLAWFVRELVLFFGDYHYLGGDEKYYLKFARAMINEETPDIWFWLPGWPVILSHLLRHGGVLAARHATMVMASFSCAMVFLIGARLWDNRSGLCASLLMCFLPEHIFYSHFIYAEMGLEFIIVLFTLLVVYGLHPKFQRPYVVVAFFVLGLGMLYKHFVIIPFAAMVVTLLLKGPRKLVIPMVLVFILPTFTFSVYLKSINKDPFFWIDSPIKSAQEWGQHRPIKHFHQKLRTKVVDNYFSGLKKRPFTNILRHSWRNMKHLWRPNGYVIGRIRYYRGIDNRWLVRPVVLVGYLLLLIFGFMGWLLSPPSFFKIYSIGALLLLTTLGFAWYLVARYHVPFLFFLALFSGRLIFFKKQVIN